MSLCWEDKEDQEVIDKWRAEKIKFVMDDRHTIYISRNLLCNILNKLYSEGSLKPGEEFDTTFVKGKGFVPPIESWRKKDGTRARERVDEEILDEYDRNGRGKTFGEIKKFRKEAEKLSEELEDFFDICPRCRCPAKYCSAHC